MKSSISIEYIHQCFHQVGIVGRTGAGKSSLLQAIFRCVHLIFSHAFSLIRFFFLSYIFSMVEIENGKIEIDGYNVQSVGLDVLRRGLALVPQDSTLFLGTLRDNL